MSGEIPALLRHPFRFALWAARERPAYLWSVVIGSAGPVVLVAAPPIRHYFGDYDIPPLPNTYPIPTGLRKKLTGFDDETEGQ